MIKYLNAKTGADLKLKAMVSYEQTISQLAEGQIQLAMLSPAPYVKAKKINPKIKILVTELSWNQDKTQKNDSYRSFILVRKDSSLDSIKLIKGKIFAFVSEESTSGYKVPQAFFKSQKIDSKKYFSQVLFLGAHPAVTDALAAGSIEAGATWDFNWSQAKTKHGDIFKSIWTSEAIPNLCVAAHPKLPAELQKKIKMALLEISTDRLQGLSSVGFVERADSFYDSVRKLEN